MLRLIFTVLSAFLFLQSQSQMVCTRTVADFGTFPPGGYLIDGSASLIDSSGTLYLTLSSDFYTEAGPDLFLYLSVNDEAPTVAGNTNVEVALMTSNSGAQAYQVPGNYGISDFGYVLVHCKEFDHFWDGGPLGDVSCTAITGLTENSGKERFSIINNNGSSISVFFETTVNRNEMYRLSIFSLDGKLLFRAQKPTNSTVIVEADLGSGLYVATATIDGKVVKRKFVIR